VFFLKELPEASLVRKSFTFRTMDLPPSVLLTKRSMLRWFALAFGLISQKESRSTALLVLDALFYFLVSKKRHPSSEEIREFIKHNYQVQVSDKLARYHLNKLISTGLLARKKGRYFFNPSPYAERDDLQASFDYWVKKTVQDSLDEIRKVMEKLAESYSASQPP